MDKIICYVPSEINHKVEKLSQELNLSKSKIMLYKFLSTDGIPRLELNNMDRTFTKTNNEIDKLYTLLHDDQILLLNHSDNSDKVSSDIKVAINKLNELNSKLNQIRNHNKTNNNSSPENNSNDNS